MDWSWCGCGLVSVHEIDEVWGAVGVGGFDGEFILFVIVHTVVVDGELLNAVGRVDGKLLWSGCLCWMIFLVHYIIIVVVGG